MITYSSISLSSVNAFTFAIVLILILVTTIFTPTIFNFRTPWSALLSVGIFGFIENTKYLVINRKITVQKPTYSKMKYLIGFKNPKELITNFTEKTINI